ncbi:L,D-transpeptidase [Rhizobium sp. WYCCWR10014]|uniref:L,D-transpeptidase n=1 Tax=Rhizobium sp. WYCCWR10014 TaxID=1825933 RepID=UPI000A5FBFBE|nr:L,D-transpeptidase [Rhizobium sp. WYCCWR10014]
MSLEIRVKLPANRRNTGTLEMFDTITGLRVFGPVPALGRGARETAAAHGNPDGISTQPFGDTPTGGYNLPMVLKSGAGTNHPADVYGSAGVIVMEPVSGDALTARQNGRTGLLIHSGRQVASPTPLPSHLRPTNGCIRVLESDLAALIQAMRNNAIVFPGRVSLTVGPDGPQGIIDESVSEGDPPALDGPVLP